MRGYSEREIFSGGLMTLLAKVMFIVDSIPDAFQEVRCHELTRAVGLAFGLPEACVQDGHYGFVEHSWLWVPGPPAGTLGRLGFPHVLDVYAVGRMPMVQLVACDNPALPHVGWAYRPGKPRDDINLVAVENLRFTMVDAIKSFEARGWQIPEEPTPPEPGSRGSLG